MLSILNRQPPLGPAVKRKIAYLRIFGISCLVVFGLLELASLKGYLQHRVFVLAMCDQTFMILYLLRKINTLKNPN
jgi:hypothetical protein